MQTKPSIMHWLFLPSVLLAVGSVPTWLESRLASFDLQVHDFSTTGRGLQSTIDRSPGDVVISVPADDAVAATTLLDRYPKVLGRAAQKSQEQQQHQTRLTDEQVMAAGLLLLRKDGDRYASSLPEQYSVLDMPDAFLLCLPTAYQKIIVAYKEYCEQLRESMNQLLEQAISEEDFKWAFSTVRSRCVGMDGEDDERVRTGGTDEVRVMLPGFDLLNHKFGAEAIPSYSEEEKLYVLKSNDSYSKGDQVFISYSDNRDNLKMLMTYGFCVRDNPEGVVFFDVHDLLEACALARPAHFNTAVLDQLRGLMKKIGKEKDLFVFDGREGQPRDCLVKGIGMMAEIQKQFLTEPDSSFQGDVMTALVMNRREEVSKGLGLMDQENDYFKTQESWTPMIASIAVLLQEEAKHLGSIEGAAQDTEDSTCTEGQR